MYCAEIMRSGEIMRKIFPVPRDLTRIAVVGSGAIASFLGKIQSSAFGTNRFDGALAGT
jgi:hypothetical protein